LSIPYLPGTFHPVTPLAVRLRAVVLTGLFLAGALGMPLADSALFHRAGHDPYAGVTHVEPHGGAHHADRCTLAQAAAAQRESLGSAKAIRVAPSVAVRTAVPARCAPNGTELTELQHSRAPPA
jgi:hypothetical protein